MGKLTRFSDIESTERKKEVDDLEIVSTLYSSFSSVSSVFRLWTESDLCVVSLFSRCPPFTVEDDCERSC